MDGNIVITVISMFILAVNCANLFRMFPSRFDLRVSISMMVLFAAAHIAYIFMSGPVSYNYGGLRALVYFPLLLFLLKGQLFQKLFAFSLELVLTVSVFFLEGIMIQQFVSYDSDTYYMILLVASLLIYTVYLLLVYKYWRHIFDKLFAYGRPAEWALYSFSGLFSFAVMAFSKIILNDTALLVVLLLFILWSFAILCFAIINTHEKSKQRYDAAFARDIISSGREHYQKMNEMFDTIRILRHDYKYHLATTSELLRSGNQEEIDQYLKSVEVQLSEQELQDFCKNPVINALIASYAERCTERNIQYDVRVTLPEIIPAANYEMCIILGNLLENAMEGCQKIKAGGKIELIIKPQGKQLAVMVKNSFDGVICQDGEQPVSAKKDGGLGLRSVQAVASRYGGELLTEWNRETFTAYVLIGL